MLAVWMKSSSSMQAISRTRDLLGVNARGLHVQDDLARHGSGVPGFGARFKPGRAFQMVAGRDAPPIAVDTTRHRSLGGACFGRTFDALGRKVGDNDRTCPARQSSPRHVSITNPPALAFQRPAVPRQDRRDFSSVMPSPLAPAALNIRRADTTATLSTSPHRRSRTAAVPRTPAAPCPSRLQEEPLARSAMSGERSLRASSEPPGFHAPPSRGRHVRQRRATTRETRHPPPSPPHRPTHRAVHLCVGIVRLAHLGGEHGRRRRLAHADGTVRPMIFIGRPSNMFRPSISLQRLQAHIADIHIGRWARRRKTLERRPRLADQHGQPPPVMPSPLACASNGVSSGL